MKMTSTKNGNSNVVVKESPKLNIKPIKIQSENLITTSSISSSKQSNLLYKAKSRNSAAINNAIANANLTSNGTDTREKPPIREFNNNSNLSKVKRVSDTNHLKESKIRRDFKGNPIVKGRKKHRISFKDILDKNAELVEVVDVESYKDYNAKELTIFEEKQTSLNGNLNVNSNSNDNTSCACIVF